MWASSWKPSMLPLLIDMCLASICATLEIKLRFLTISNDPLRTPHNFHPCNRQFSWIEIIWAIISVFSRVDLPHVDIDAVMLQILRHVCRTIAPIFAPIKVCLLLVESLTDDPGYSVVGLPRLAAHYCIGHRLLKRSPELRRRATGLVSLVASPIRKMQLSPKENE